MKDPTRQAHRAERTASATAAIEVEERRSAPRQQFVAEAQIVEISSGVRLSARSCDLVVHGCYVDTLVPFPVGTLVRIRLRKEKAIVEANGNVVYRLPGLGMGIAFHDLTPEGRAAIDKWLSQMSGPPGSLEALMPPIDPGPPHLKVRRPSAEFVELVQLLNQKGLLTKAEAVGLLRGPLDE